MRLTETQHRNQRKKDESLFVRICLSNDNERKRKFEILVLLYLFVLVCNFVLSICHRFVLRGCWVEWVKGKLLQSMEILHGGWIRRACVKTGGYVVFCVYLREIFGLNSFRSCHANHQLLLSMTINICFHTDKWYWLVVVVLINASS